jgi:anti-anti-sigma factor
MDSAATVNPGLELSARAENGITIARLAGELGLSTAPGLREQLLGLLRPGASRLVIDLSAVSFCDPSGLAVLVGAGRRATLLGGYVHLAAVSPEAVRMLGITGLGPHLSVFPTVGAAMSAPGTPHGKTAAAA